MKKYFRYCAMSMMCAALGVLHIALFCLAVTGENTVVLNAIIGVVALVMSIAFAGVIWEDNDG